MAVEARKVEAEVVTSLVVAEEINALEVFTSEGVDPIIAEVRKKAKELEPDTTTAKGRSAIKSMGYKVAQSKTLLDKMGKALTDEWARQKAVVDASRRKVRDELDALKAEVLEPVVEWERKEEARLEAEKLAAQVESDHEAALNENAEFDAERIRRIEFEAEQERQRQEREKLDAEKAELERQKREIAEREEADRLEKERIERGKREAEERKKREEQIRKEAAEKAEREKKEALERAEREKQEAIQAEKDRQAAEEQKRKEEEEKQRRDAEKKAANKRHQAKINREAVAGIRQADKSISEEVAKSIVSSIAKGQVPHTTISY